MALLATSQSLIKAAAASGRMVTLQQRAALSFKAKSKHMEQVEVDEQHVKDQLGQQSMAFVKKAEKMNRQRASKHVVFRRKDWIIGGSCFGLAIAIYAYTIYAMKQERFLDDFEMPDPLDDSERK